MSVQVHWSLNSEELFFFHFHSLLWWHFCELSWNSAATSVCCLDRKLTLLRGNNLSSSSWYLFWKFNKKSILMDMFQNFSQRYPPKERKIKECQFFSSSFPRSVDAIFKDNMGGINSVSWMVTLLWVFDGHINPYIWFNQAILPSYLGVEAEKWSVKTMS